MLGFMLNQELLQALHAEADGMWQHSTQGLHQEIHINHQ
jgi:hypothetical protein